MMACCVQFIPTMCHSRRAVTASVPCHLLQLVCVRAALAAVCFAGVVACTPYRAGDRASNSAGAEGQVITAEEIQASGARTAWDVVSRRGTRLNLSKTADGAVGQVSRPGMDPNTDCPAPGACQAVAIQIFVDGVRINDAQYLRTLPAENILRIEILNGRDAVAEYGPKATGGVIVIVTKNRSTSPQGY